MGRAWESPSLCYQRLFQNKYCEGECPAPGLHFPIGICSYRYLCFPFGHEKTSHQGSVYSSWIPNTITELSCCRQCSPQRCRAQNEKRRDKKSALPFLHTYLRGDAKPLRGCNLHAGTCLVPGLQVLVCDRNGYHFVLSTNMDLLSAYV